MLNCATSSAPPTGDSIDSNGSTSMRCDALAAKGIEIIDWADLDDDERALAAVEFETRIFPILTPLAVDPGHPFPYISNLSLNLAVQVFDPPAVASASPASRCHHRSIGSSPFPRAASSRWNR
ncbi:MAG: hypothetical protein R2710_02560 [Acidimicrobiales bacterium]